ncbi:MAG TPA: thiamine-phosphate kinase [Candidatus Binatia bacterium]|jgi:thiamine-monophosphate kinase
MRLSKLGEFGLIDRIRKAAPKGPGVRVGIGDDAAWLDCRSRTFLLTTDLLIEGIHFDFRWTTCYALGYKTLAVNLSDIAAMGGAPAYLTLSLGIPVDFKIADVEEFYRGVKSLAGRNGVSLVGGDTSAANRFFIGASLVGHCPHAPVLRSGAKEGDDLYVTGTLGDSALGLDLLKKKKVARGNAAAYCIRRHQFPAARLQAGTLLAREKLARAMIDVSDGLLQDLHHICKSSAVGAEVWENALPLSTAYKRLAGRKRPVRALTGGEDYELLFCARRSDRQRLEKMKPRLGAPITRIGKCLPARSGIRIIGLKGRPASFSLSGYDHFKSES